jgi:large subunit ribosomal protein L10
MVPRQTKQRRTATHIARPEKVQEVEALRQRLAQVAAAIFTDFRGLNVGEIAQLRGKLREAGAEYKVVKNTLLQRAAQSLGVDGLTPFLQGPTAVAFSPTDPVGPAKVLLDYIRLMRKLEIKGGVIEGRVMPADQIRRLADLPSKRHLLASVLASMQAPLAGLAGVLTGLQRNLVYALDQIRKKQEHAA